MGLSEIIGDPQVTMIVSILSSGHPFSQRIWGSGQNGQNGHRWLSRGIFPNRGTMAFSGQVITLINTVFNFGASGLSQAEDVP